MDTPSSVLRPHALDYSVQKGGMDCSTPRNSSKIMAEDQGIVSSSYNEAWH